MKPLFHPHLIHDPFGDPGLYVEFFFERRAILFDLGDLHPLSPRKILRVTDIFVSHAHMDHFSGFDWLLRIILGREARVRLFGPPGFIEKTAHKLAAYSWNLVESYENDLALEVAEVHSNRLQVATFRCRNRFRPEREKERAISDDLILEEPAFRVRAVSLDHRIPSLAFALEERFHLNVLKTGLQSLGLPVGPWLRELKEAVIQGVPEDRPFRAWWKEEGEIRERWFPLGELVAHALRRVPGQKIAYVVDAVFHPENQRRITDLARGADFLFIEASFLHEDVDRAAEKYHLTARQAGLLAREAGVARVVPFHFSPKYKGEELRILQEVQEGFTSGFEGARGSAGESPGTSGILHGTEGTGRKPGGSG